MDNGNFYIIMVGFILIILPVVAVIIKLKKEAPIQAKVDPKIVVIGGGTGQSIFLRGLKNYTKNITAVVTVADDGGGSGVLREDLGMLPPGDIRNCILALADMEPTMEKVMQYRFEEGSLKGQSFGNLFLAAMNGIYGNFEVAITKISEIFAITGNVYPVTLENIKLVAKLKNGNIVEGESIIPKAVKSQDSGIEEVHLNPAKPKPLEEVLKAIVDADVVVIGPGSLYTSIIPNLLVDEMVDTIIKSKALKIYISNMMTQPGETDNYNVYDHIKSIIKHTGKGIIDAVIVNSEIINGDDLKKYKFDGATQVLMDDAQRKQMSELNIKIVENNLVEVKKSYIRHDAHKIAQIIVKLSLSKKLRSII